MTKKEAIEAMKNGKKVKHITFTKGEFIHYKNGQIYNEKNQNITGEFLLSDDYKCFDDNWTIHT